MGEKKPKRYCWIENNICHIPLSGGSIAKCDEDRFEEVKNKNWFLSSKGYPEARKTDKNHRVSLHRYLYPEIPLIDHINRNKKDNRSCNLRAATFEINKRNRAVQSSSVSGFKGVNFFPKKNIFIAYLWNNKKRKILGRFETAIEAAICYDKATFEIFGDPSFLNFPNRASNWSYKGGF